MGERGGKWEVFLLFVLNPIVPHVCENAGRPCAPRGILTLNGARNTTQGWKKNGEKQKNREKNEGVECRQERGLKMLRIQGEVTSNGKPSV